MPPKCGNCFSNCAIIRRLARSPPSRKQLPIKAAAEPLIYQEDYSPIVIGADQPPNCLQDTVHARESVSVLKTRNAAFVPVLTDQIPFQADLRQSHPDDRDAD